MATKKETYRPLTIDELSVSKQGQLAIEALKENPLKLEKTDEGEAVFPYQKNTSLDTFYLTFGDLMISKSLEQFEQLSIYHDKGFKRIGYILGSKPDGLAFSRVLIKDIEVGYLVSQLDENGQPNEGEIPTIVGGRNRLVALLTAYEVSGVKVNSTVFKNAYIRVQPKVFESLADMLQYIEADNDSRSMSRTEHINIRVAQQDVDTDDIDSIINWGTENPGKLTDAFRLAFVWMVRHPGVDGVPSLPRSVELHTAGQIGSTYGTLIKKEQNFKRALHDSMFIAKVLSLGFEHLSTYLQNPEDSNIARSATRLIAPYIYRQVEGELLREKAVVDAAKKAEERAAKKAEKDSKPSLEETVTSQIEEEEKKPRRRSRKPVEVEEPKASTNGKGSGKVVEMETKRNARRTKKEDDGVGEKPQVKTRQRKAAATAKK